MFALPVMKSLDRTGRTPCRPRCSGRPLSARYWEAAALGTNPNLLLRTESQHTSVDSDHSSAQWTGDRNSMKGGKEECTFNQAAPMDKRDN